MIWSYYDLTDAKYVRMNLTQSDKTNSNDLRGKDINVFIYKITSLINPIKTL